MNQGFNHVGLATNDIDATIAFYRDVLGFKVVRYDGIRIFEGGTIRHVFMDVGANQLISFMQPHDVPGVANPIEADINAGLGVPRAFYHFAFHCDSEVELQARRAQLLAAGIEVTDVFNHDWCKSIYFFDPVNGLGLEFTAYAREFTTNDAEFEQRIEAPIVAFNFDALGMKAGEDSRWEHIKEVVSPVAAP